MHKLILYNGSLKSNLVKVNTEKCSISEVNFEKLHENYFHVNRI